MVRKFEEFFGAKQQDAEVLSVINERFDLSDRTQYMMMQIMEGLYDALKEAYAYVAESNEYIKRVEAQLVEVQSVVETVSEQTQDILAMTQEEREKHFVGKESEFLDAALELAKEVTYDEVRKLVYRATGNQQDGYNTLYGKLFAQTGYDVYADGKKRVKKSDNLVDANGQYVSISKTRYNAVFLARYKAELYLLAKEMLKG